MPTLPVVKVTKPAILAGLTNGKLPSSVLVTWTPSWSSTPVTLVAPALRAYKALTTAAYRAGFALKSVGSYRTYERQVALFKERYRRVQYETGTWWDNSFWIHASGAQAAIPGTSNHGLGLADDAGEELDGDPGAESISARAVAWLIANEHRFGFSHEVQSEPWHIRYWAGDAIPAAVIAFEEGDDDVSDAYDLLVTGLRPGAPSQTHTPEPRYPSIPNSAVLDKIWRASIDARIAADGVIALKSVVEQLADIIRQGGGSADTAAILRGVDERLAEQRSAIEADTRDAVADLAEGGAAAVRTNN